jgi:hypothetical protein
VRASETGYIFVFDEPKRSEELRGLLPRAKTFTDTISVPDWPLKGAYVVFLSLDGAKLTHLALARRGKNVASFKAQVRFTHIIPFRPLPFDDIETKMQGSLRRYFLRVSSGSGGRVPPATWSELLRVLFDARPEVKADFEIVERAAHRDFVRVSGPAGVTLGEERDAFTLALRLFDVDLKKQDFIWDGDASTPIVNGVRQLEKRKAPRDERVAPFYRGLTRVYADEDRLIAHDAQTLPGWIGRIPNVVGGVTFTRNEDHITIINANRGPIESALGVDLLYYHHRFASFVAVQYKRMKKENDELSYRPDASYAVEVERMRTFRAAHGQAAIAAADHYRLNPETFFFKLCRIDYFEPDFESLAKGLYIPLDYHDVLIETGAAIGPRGGVSLGYRTIARHLDNELFIRLFQQGWIGSRGTTTDALVALTKDLLEQGRSVLVAVTEKNKSGKP